MERHNPFKKDEMYNLTLSKIGKYELEFYVFEGKSEEPLLYVKSLETATYNYVGDFYRFCWDAKEIREDLLPTIQEVINKGWGDEVLSSELLTAIIEPGITYFTNNHNLKEGKEAARKDERMQIPTEDFRQISLRWLEFLESQNNT